LWGEKEKQERETPRTHHPSENHQGEGRKKAGGKKIQGPVANKVLFTRDLGRRRHRKPKEMAGRKTNKNGGGKFPSGKNVQKRPRKNRGRQKKKKMVRPAQRRGCLHPACLLAQKYASRRTMKSRAPAYTQTAKDEWGLSRKVNPWYCRKRHQKRKNFTTPQAKRKKTGSRTQQEAAGWAHE